MILMGPFQLGIFYEYESLVTSVNMILVTGDRLEGLLTNLPEPSICTVMFNMNDKRKLYMANHENLKCHHCRELPTFSGQHPSAINLLI